MLKIKSAVSTTTLVLSLGLTCGSLLTACGQSSVAQPTAGASTASNGGTGGTIIPGPTHTSTSNLNPTLNDSFTLSGGSVANETTFVMNNVVTDSTLQVKITPGAAAAVSVPGYGYTADYGCLQVSYTVSDTTGIVDFTTTTQVMAVNGGSGACQNAETSDTQDLSNRLTPGHGTISITVSNPKYDFYCQLCYWNPYLFNAQYYGCNAYCPVRPLYKTHTATGTLSVATDSTQPLL